MKVNIIACLSQLIAGLPLHNVATFHSPPLHSALPRHAMSHPCQLAQPHNLLINISIQSIFVEFVSSQVSNTHTHTPNHTPVQVALLANCIYKHKQYSSGRRVCPLSRQSLPNRANELRPTKTLPVAVTQPASHTLSMRPCSHLRSPINRYIELVSSLNSPTHLYKKTNTHMHACIGSGAYLSSNLLGPINMPSFQRIGICL